MQWKHLSNIERKEKDHESSRTTDKKKRRNGTGDMKTAGQTYPEPSPYDRLILDQHVRYVGDPVAIVAGENEACVDKALKMLKVEYEVLPAVLDFHTAKDNEVLVHPEEQRSRP